ncbi:MAG: hypothetical protein R3F62_09370 [Planctomycetota bacterium]
MKAWLKDGRFETGLALAIVIVTLVIFWRFQDDAELQVSPPITAPVSGQTAVETH